MRAVIIGATGGHGRALAARLKRDGHWVRGFVRDAARAPECLDDIVVGDAITGAGLRQAFDDAEVAYSFVHSFEPGVGGVDLRDVFAALQFVRAAHRTGLARAVFFSIYMPADGHPPTPYQANRMAVEQVLLDGLEGAVVLRSGISLGSGLRGIRPYLRLVQRLPVIPLGPWRHNPAAVVDLGTELDCLVAAGTRADLSGNAWDVPPSAEPTHVELVRALADVLGLRRAVWGLPYADPRLIATITGEDRQLCDYLIGVSRTEYRHTPSRTDPFGDLTPMPMRPALAAAVADWQDLPRYARTARRSAA